MFENYTDWKIHRKLEEARRVYIYPARCNGKTRMLLDLIDSGEEVVAVRKADLPGKDVTVERLNRAIRDRDLCIETRWEKLIDEYIYDQFKKELMKPFVVPEPEIVKPEYKIIPMPDTYIYSPKIHCEWMVRNTYFPEVFKVKDEVDEPDPLWTKKGE